MKWGLIWFWSIRYSSSCFCFSSSSRLFIRAVTLLDRLLMPRPTSPSSLFHSMEGSAVKSPAEMRAICRCSRFSGRAIARWSSSAMAMPMIRMASEAMLSGANIWGSWLRSCMSLHTCTRYRSFIPSG